MKGRVARIFEIWNQRNTEYYREAFRKLEKEDKVVFNFVAALYPFQWLVFRKMYGLAIALATVYMVVQTIFYSFIKNSDTSWMVLLAFSVILFVVFGFFGNEIYYREVKSKVAKGYAKIEDFNPISPMWSILSVVVPSFISYAALRLFVMSESGVRISILSWIAMGLVVAAPWIIDQKKFQSQESFKEVKVDENSVNKYLEKSDSSSMSAAFGVLLAYYLVSFLSGAAQYVNEDKQITDKEVAQVINEVDRDAVSSDLSDAELDALIKDSSAD